MRFPPAKRRAITNDIDRGPGKGVDDDTLYGSGQCSNLVVDRLLKDDGHSGGLCSSTTNPPGPVGSGDQDMSNLVESKDHTTAVQQPSRVEKDTTSVTDGHNEASKADANLLAAHEADKLSTGEMGRSSTNEGASTLRPEYPTPASAGSNASIKSNVVGRVPTGSSLVQEEGDLPRVPATDGKFLNDESLAAGAPASRKQASLPYVIHFTCRNAWPNAAIVITRPLLPSQAQLSAVTEVYLRRIKPIWRTSWIHT